MALGDNIKIGAGGGLTNTSGSSIKSSDFATKNANDPALLTVSGAGNPLNTAAIDPSSKNFNILKSATTGVAGTRPVISNTVKVPPPEPDMDAKTLSDSITGNTLNLNTTQTRPPSTSNINASSDAATQTFLASLEERKVNQASAAQRQADADKDLDRLRAEQGAEAAQAQKTALAGQDSTELKKTELERNLEALGVDMQEFTSLATGVAQLQGELGRLNAEELAVVEEARLRGETTSFAGGQVAQERRQFAVQRAGLSAELGAKAALLQALQGNFKLANDMSNEIVENAFADRQDQLDNLNEIIDNNLDIIEALDKADTEAIKERAKAEAELIKEEKDTLRDKLKMITADPKAAQAAGFTSISAINEASFEDFSLSMAKNKTSTGDDDTISLGTPAKTKLLGAGYSTGDVNEIERSVNDFGIEDTLRAEPDEERRVAIAEAYSAETILNRIIEEAVPVDGGKKWYQFWK